MLSDAERVTVGGKTWERQQEGVWKRGGREVAKKEEESLGEGSAFHRQCHVFSIPHFILFVTFWRLYTIYTRQHALKSNCDLHLQLLLYIHTHHLFILIINLYLKYFKCNNNCFVSYWQVIKITNNKNIYICQ